MTEEMDGQISLFDQDFSYGKMFQAHYQAVPQVERTSESSWKKSQELPSRMPMCLDLRNHGLIVGASWDRDGLLLGGFQTISFGERPSEERESHLSQILQANVPQTYYLSATACKGILRRAKQRGKELPELLRMVLEKQSHSRTDADVMGGARECLSSETEPEHCQPCKISSYCIVGGQVNDAVGMEEEICKTLNCMLDPMKVLAPKGVVYGISSQNSNAMKSSNPNSGIYKADTSKTIDVSGVNPSCNQGGMVVVDSCIELMGGQKSLNQDKVGSLCARDKKGVGNQYVDEGKVIIDRCK